MAAMVRTSRPRSHQSALHRRRCECLVCLDTSTDIVLPGHPGCSHRVLQVRAKGTNTCVAGRGTQLHGASFKNPLKKKDLDSECEGTQEADVAFINGDEAVIKIVDMSEEDKSGECYVSRVVLCKMDLLIEMAEMYALATAETAVAAWPESLKQYLIDHVDAV